MLTVRLLPPANNRVMMTVNGRTYVGVTGTPQDVPFADAGVLQANGWGFLVANSGPTSQRPSPAAAAMFYFDTDIAQMIIADGATWRSPVDGSAV